MGNSSRTGVEEPLRGSLGDNAVSSPEERRQQLCDRKELRHGVCVRIRLGTTDKLAPKWSPIAVVMRNLGKILTVVERHSQGKERASGQVIVSHRQGSDGFEYEVVSDRTSEYLKEDLLVTHLERSTTGPLVLFVSKDRGLNTHLHG